MYVSYKPTQNDNTLYRVTVKSTGAVSVSNIGTYNKVVGYLAKSALSSPGWVNGVRKASSYSRKVTVSTCTPQVWAVRDTPTAKYEQLGGWGVTSPSLLTLCDVSYPRYTSLLASLKARAETECRAKLNHGPVDFGVALGESRQMIRHIVHTSERVIGIVAAVLRKSSKSRFAASAPDLWLEYQYAWKPLLSDIYGTYQLIQDGLASNGQVLSASRTVKEQMTISATSGGLTIPIPVTVSVNCSLSARVHDQRIAGLRSLGLINPALVAWNVLPWSFVFDWFIPVGTFLEAVSATAGLTFVTGSYTRHIHCDHEYTFEYTPSGYDSPNHAHFDLKGISMNRGVYGAFPLPRIYRDWSPFTDQRTVSAIALLLGRFRNRK